jgi:hypothetical protein
MKQPPSFVDSSLPSYVCRLHKSLYGLKQASRAWYHRLSVFLLFIDFHASKFDTSLFILSLVLIYFIFWFMLMISYLQVATLLCYTA